MKLNLAVSAGLAGQRGPGICLSPVPQRWSNGCTPSHLSFVWVPGIQTRVPICAQPGLYSLSRLRNPYFLCFDVSISCAFIFPHRLHYSTDSSDLCLSLAVEDARLCL